MDKKRKWFIFISILLTIVSIALGLTIFFAAYKRLWETLGDLAVSAKFYFFEILQIEHTVNPSVTNPSDVLESTPMLPETPDLFRLRTSIFFKLFFYGGNIKGFGMSVGEGAGKVARYLVLFLPFVLLLVFVVKRLYAMPNTKTCNF